MALMEGAMLEVQIDSMEVQIENLLSSCHLYLFLEEHFLLELPSLCLRALQMDCQILSIEIILELRFRFVTHYHFLFQDCRMESVLYFFEL